MGRSGGMNRRKYYHGRGKPPRRSGARGGGDDMRTRHALFGNEDGSIGQILSPSNREQVDSETLGYFSEIFALISEGGSVSDPIEKAALAASTLEETRGKELAIACHTGCSRVLERLLISCDIVHTLDFLNNCASVLPLMSVDPLGSHVVQVIMRSISNALLQHDQHATWTKTLEMTLSKVCKVLGEKATEVMCSRYGSHVLRDLISLLSGVSVGATASIKSQTQLEGRFLVKAVSKDIQQLKHPEFPELLRSLVTIILEACREKIVQLRADSAAGLVLQDILKALSGDEELVSFAIFTILGCGKDAASREGKAFEDAHFNEVTDMMKDQSSSHLMEVILQTAPDALYMEIFQRFFRHHMLPLSLHQYANFVTQSLIAFTRHQGQVNMILDELEGSFSLLMEERRGGVISSILAACGRLRTRQREACRAIARAINPAASTFNVLVPHMLFLEDFGFCKKIGKHWEPNFAMKMSFLGCAMLQMIFSFPQECSQQFSTSFAALEADQLLEIVKDVSGSRVMEAFISSGAPMKQKQRSISKLKGHFAELGTYPVSSYTVEKCFSIAGINLKEIITRELISIQDELARSKHGPYLLKRCDASGYVKEPDQWRLRQTSKQGNLEAFTELFNGDTLSKKGHENLLATPEDASELARDNINQEHKGPAIVENEKVDADVQPHISQEVGRSQSDERHVNKEPEVNCEETNLILTDSKKNEAIPATKTSKDDIRPKMPKRRFKRTWKNFQHPQNLNSKVIGQHISAYTLQTPDVSVEKKAKIGTQG